MNAKKNLTNPPVGGAGSILDSMNPASRGSAVKQPAREGFQKATELLNPVILQVPQIAPELIQIPKQTPDQIQKAANEFEGLAPP